MKILFYITGVICIAGWAVSVFMYNATDLIHSLLAFSVVFFLMGAIGNEQVVPISGKELDL